MLHAISAPQEIPILYFIQCLSLMITGLALGPRPRVPPSLGTSTTFFSSS